MDPKDVEATEGENGSPDMWLKPRADTGVAWCMRFLVLFAVLVIIAELALLIYLAVLNQDVLFKFNTPFVPLAPFAWTAALLPGNISISTSEGQNAISYEALLKIQPDLQNFNGSMKLAFTTTSPLTGLVLHGRDLLLNRAYLMISGTEGYDAKSITYNDEHEYIVIEYPKALPVGHLEVQLEWSGEVGTGTEGLYRSEYVDENSPTGAKRVLLATQFEPNYARRVFPCFDEPAYRAFWTIKVDAPISLGTHAYSNTEMATEPVITGQYVHYEFEETKTAVPAYLLALVIGDLSCAVGEWSSTRHLPLQVCYTRPSQEPLAQFALEAARKFMEYFELITGLDYGYLKLDLVAIPDFSAGAMENPGLITFRETALLTDGPIPSFASKMRVAEIVAHEVAHQWYGNQLGPVYWNDLWVAEGSATYWSYVALDSQYPEFQYSNNFFLTDEWIPAMQADELLATSPVYRNVTTPTGARNIFDVTTYSKGASILRHINSQLTASEMMTSMSDWFRLSGGAVGATMNSTEYLREVTRKAATARQSVGPNAMPYIFNPTFPVVNFSYPMNSTSYTLTATMQSYSALYANQMTEDTTAQWNIPLNVRTSAGAGAINNYGTLSASNRNVSIPPQNAWYKANVNAAMYYRVQYPLSNWQQLITAIQNNDTRLSTNDRASLISDAFTWAEIGQLPYSVVFQLLNASLVPTEVNYAVWKSAMAELLILDDVLQDEFCVSNFDLMMAKYLTPAFNYWTWDTTTINNGTENSTTVIPTASDVVTRNIILSTGAEYISSSGYTQYAIDAVNAYLNDPTANPLPLDTAAALLKVASTHGSVGLWKRIWNRYIAATNPSEKTTLLTSLGWTRHRELARDLLSKSLDTDLIRSQDQYIVLRTISLNRYVGAETIWTFFRDNFLAISTLFPQNLGSWVSPLTAFTQTYRIQEINDLFKVSHPDLGVDPAPITEIIADNAAWLAQFGPQLCDYLVAAYPNPDVKRATLAASRSL